MPKGSKKGSAVCRWKIDSRRKIAKWVVDRFVDRFAKKKNVDPIDVVDARRIPACVADAGMCCR